MLSDKRFTYYQPEYRHVDFDDFKCDNASLPEGLHSFQAFPTREECEGWLKNHDYNPAQFVIRVYHDDSIENVTLIDSDGDTLLRIEELEEDGLVNLIGDEVLYDVVGGMNKLKTSKRDDETQQEYEDRIYTEALNRVNDAIMNIEESGAYNFQSYCGTPDVEWYDNVRDWVVEDVMAWMRG